MDSIADVHLHFFKRTRELFVFKFVSALKANISCSEVHCGALLCACHCTVFYVSLCFMALPTLPLVVMTLLLSHTQVVPACAFMSYIVTFSFVSLACSLRSSFSFIVFSFCFIALSIWGSKYFLNLEVCFVRFLKFSSGMLLVS